mmetsp:Transcript_50854/g.149859  ORF Transcript_50854/g.149859 Transcript_50854/m.149859 type:complete len:105 (+) Transcript_50854:1090-1404(+)
MLTCPAVHIASATTSEEVTYCTEYSEACKAATGRASSKASRLTCTGESADRKQAPHAGLRKSRPSRQGGDRIMGILEETTKSGAKVVYVQTCHKPANTSSMMML